MDIIPVIDIRHGAAVRAVAGDRGRYRPLETPLAAGSDPLAVARGFAALFPFRTLYVADLDGIEGRGADASLHRSLAAAWPGAELWIDDGSADIEKTDVGIPPLLTSPTRGEEFCRVPLAGQIPSPLWGGPGWEESRTAPMIKSHVLGSESFATLDGYERARRSVGDACILSLDFRGDEFLGYPALLENAALWPSRIIVMTLARVGTSLGPDIARLTNIAQRAGPRKVYAAGGVRDRDDLERLREAGAAGALLASALHDGRIKTGDLEEIAGK